MKTSVDSDYRSLRCVLVHSPGPERRGTAGEGRNAIAAVTGSPTLAAESRDHARFKALLVGHVGKSNVHELTDLLVEAFDSADGRGRLEIAGEILHGRAATYLAHLRDQRTALETRSGREFVDDLVLGCPRRSRGRPVLPPLRSLMWVRDSAVTTPAGVIIGCSGSPHRELEPALVRAVLRHHTRFESTSVFLDLLGLNRRLRGERPRSDDAHYSFEGGNAVVLGGGRLAIGVPWTMGARSRCMQQRATERVVQAILRSDTDGRILRIYVVWIPRPFHHLDSIFSLVGPGCAVVMPYVLGWPVINRADALWLNLLQWMNMPARLRRHAWGMPSRIGSAEHCSGPGSTLVYDRDDCSRAGRLTPNPIVRSFVTQLAADGILDMDRIAWVGGTPDDHGSPRDHMRSALREQLNQAANCLTIGPLNALVCSDNTLTSAALAHQMQLLDARARLDQMPSTALSRGYGGPRCLTLPLSRE